MTKPIDPADLPDLALIAEQRAALQDVLALIDQGQPVRLLIGGGKKKPVVYPTGEAFRNRLADGMRDEIETMGKVLAAHNVEIN